MTIKNSHGAAFEHVYDCEYSKKKKKIVTILENQHIYFIYIWIGIFNYRFVKPMWWFTEELFRRGTFPVNGPSKCCFCFSEYISVVIVE